jgi:hypothetical protein
MIINTSIFNAWIYPVLGALAMIVGQMFGPDLFLITSNSGILLYMLSMTRVLYEIRHDIRQAGDLGNFLIALEHARSDKNGEGNHSPSARVQEDAIEASYSSDEVPSVHNDKELGVSA